MTAIEQRITTKNFVQETYIPIWVNAFLVDRKAQGLTTSTLKFYHEKLFCFERYCDGQSISQIDQITPNTLREFLLWLEEAQHNPGGVAAHYRAIRAFLKWWQVETEPEGWKNPIEKVKQPRVSTAPLEPVPIEDIKLMLATCEKNFTGERDRAIFLALLDTGCRARELLRVDMGDVDPVTGTIVIRESKNRKPRTVFLGQRARKALRTYLKYRTDGQPPLWVSVQGERLTYSGLRMLITRRAKKAGVSVPLPHAWRRAFALESLRNGVDIYSLEKLGGWSGLQVIRRYLAQTDNDLRAAHDKGSPVDNGL